MRADPDAELDLLVLARLDVEVHRGDGRNLLARRQCVRAAAGRGGAARRHGTVLPIFLGPAFSLYRIAARARDRPRLRIRCRAQAREAGQPLRERTRLPRSIEASDEQPHFLLPAEDREPPSLRAAHAQSGAG